MDIDRVAYVIEQLKNGVSTESLHEAFIKAGYQEDTIANLFEEARVRLSGIENVEVDVGNNNAAGGISPAFSAEPVSRSEFTVHSTQTKKLTLLISVLSVTLITIATVGWFVLENRLFNSSVEKPTQVVEVESDNRVPGGEMSVAADAQTNNIASDTTQGGGHTREETDSTLGTQAGNTAIIADMQNWLNRVNNSTVASLENLPNGVVNYQGSAVFGHTEEADVILENPLLFSDVSLEFDFANGIVRGHFYNFKSHDGSKISGEVTITNSAIDEATYVGDASGVVTDGEQEYNLTGVVVGQILGNQAGMAGGGLAANYVLDDGVGSVIYSFFGVESISY